MKKDQVDGCVYFVRDPPADICAGIGAMVLAARRGGAPAAARVADRVKVDG